MTLPPGIKILIDEPLSRWTGFKVGGPADYLCLPADVDQLAAALAWADQEGLPVTVLGGGFNTLASDEGVAGAVISLRENFDRLVADLGRDRVALRAGAGLRLSRLVGRAAAEGWADLAFLAGIPGTLGGAAMMNAGAWDRSLAEVITGLTVLGDDQKPRRLSAEEAGFGYRRADGLAGRLVLEVELQSSLASPAEVSREVNRILARRKERQPIEAASAGSFFKNRPGEPAGRLIEAAGLKGRRMGGAMVSDKHANFIINTGGATAADIVALAELVAEEVKRTSGVELTPEVRYIGRGRNKWPWP